MAGCAAIASLWAQGVQAQELDEVIVTALKRDTALQETPLAITAVGGAELNRMGAVAAEDIVRTVPGLNFTNPGGPGMRRITIRGVQGGGQSTVGFYINETPVTGPNGASADPSLMTPDINFYDVKRIEVLRGPQGTLYGSGSMSGTFKVIYERADAAAYDGEVQASANTVKGGGDGYTVRGMANLPLVADRLAVRAVAYDEVRAGYVDNIALRQDDINESRVYGGRLLVDFTPTDTVSLHLLGILQKSALDDASFWFAGLGVHKTNTPTKTPFPSDFRLYSATLEWALPFADLTTTSSYWKWDTVRNLDNGLTLPFTLAQAAQCPRFIGIAGPCDAAQRAQWTNYVQSFGPLVNRQPLTAKSTIQEARLTSNGEGRLTWAVGGYLEERKDAAVSAVVGADPVTGIVKFPLVQEFARELGVSLRQTAVFGEATYRPVEALSITLGARRYAYKNHTYAQVTDTSFINASVAGPPAFFATNDKGWVTKVNVSYDVTGDLMVYAQRSEGFRPGGVNSAPALPPEFVSFGPDELVNYEGGVKSTWFDGRMTLNAAAYRINWSNMQVAVRIPSFQFNANLGAAKVYGFEIEGAARPMTGLTLRGNLAVNHGELKQDQIAGGGVTAAGLKGDRIPNEPSFTGALSVEYLRPVLDNVDVSARIDYTYTGPSHSEYRRGVGFDESMGHFSQVNVRLGLEAADWGVSLFAQNLFDAVGRGRVFSFILTEQQTISLPPRTLGLELRKRF